MYSNYIILNVGTAISRKVLFLAGLYKMLSKLETVFYIIVYISTWKDLNSPLQLNLKNCDFSLAYTRYTRYIILSFALSGVRKTNDCNWPLGNYNFVQPALER